MDKLENDSLNFHTKTKNMDEMGFEPRWSYLSSRLSLKISTPKGTPYLAVTSEVNATHLVGVVIIRTNKRVDRNKLVLYQLK